MEKYLFSQLNYEPNDFVSVRKALIECTNLVRRAESVTDVVCAIEKQENLMDQVSLAYNLSNIRSSLDCTDTFYQEAVRREGTGLSLLDTSDYYRALLDSPFLLQLQNRYGSEFVPVLENNFRIRSSGHELMAREQELVSLYQQKKAMLRAEFRGRQCSEGEMIAAFDDPSRETRLAARKAMAQAVLTQKEEFASLLLELVAVRDRIAKANGFPNYLEYANAMYDRREYGEAEMTEFCGHVKKELVPLLGEVQEEQRRELGLEKMMYYDRGLYSTDGNAAPAGNAVYLMKASEKMYDALSPAFGRFYRGMVAAGSMDVSPSSNKIAGMGFCSDVKKGCYPFVFGNCNGTTDDVSVFTHEMGHAWQAYLTEQNIELSLLRDMALDVAEIPSKTMELFSYPYAEIFFGEDAAKFRKMHFRDALRQVASYCSIHETNTWIYTHVGASFEEITAKVRENARQYDPDLDYGELDVYNAQGADLIRNMAIYMIPRYVISYALSQMCAIDFFRRMQEDPKTVWESYEKLCASGGSRKYSDTLACAGLEPAYTVGTVRKVVAFAREYMGF